MFHVKHFLTPFLIKKYCSFKKILKISDNYLVINFITV